MKTISSVAVIAVLLLAAPFASALSREEVGRKALAHLRPRQAGCLTAACTDFALTIATCVGEELTDPIKALVCLCANKPVAMACFATCQDGDTLTEQQFDEACRDLPNVSATFASIITQLSSLIPPTQTAAVTTTTPAPATTPAPSTVAPVSTTTVRPAAAGRNGVTVAVGAVALAGVAGAFAAL